MQLRGVTSIPALCKSHINTSCCICLESKKEPDSVISEVIRHVLFAISNASFLASFGHTENREIVLWSINPPAWLRSNRGRNTIPNGVILHPRRCYWSALNLKQCQRHNIRVEMSVWYPLLQGASRSSTNPWFTRRMNLDPTYRTELTTTLGTAACGKTRHQSPDRTITTAQQGRTGSCHSEPFFSLVLFRKCTSWMNMPCPCNLRPTSRDSSKRMKVELKLTIFGTGV